MQGSSTARPGLRLQGDASRKPCQGGVLERECSQGNERVCRNRVREWQNAFHPVWGTDGTFTGRSTNGRSSAFDALCPGSNPSRPTSMSTPCATGCNIGRPRQLRVHLPAATCRGKLEWISKDARLSGTNESAASRDRSQSFERVKSLDFCRIRNEDVQDVREPQRGFVRRSSRNYPRSTSLEGFDVNKQDTTAVLSPISGQAEETGTSSQPAPAPAQSGFQPNGLPARTAPERKRSGRLSEDKRFKIFCGSANSRVERGDLQVCRCAAGRDPAAAVLRRRGSFSAAGECSRRGCVSGAAHVFPGGSSTWWSC